MAYLETKGVNDVALKLLFFFVIEYGAIFCFVGKFC
jgi:hypothetical protein